MICDISAGLARGCAPLTGFMPWLATATDARQGSRLGPSCAAHLSGSDKVGCRKVRARMNLAEVGHQGWRRAVSFRGATKSEQWQGNAAQLQLVMML